MADDIAIPEAGEKLVTETGLAAASWYRIFARLVSAFNETTRGLTDAETGIATKADKDQTTAIVLNFEAPTDGTRRFLKWPHGWTITETTTRTAAGTATVQVKINTTNLGGGSNSASTSEASVSHSSANVVAAGDDIEVEFSSTSADCEGLALTISGTLELD